MAYAKKWYILGKKLDAIGQGTYYFEDIEDLESLPKSYTHATWLHHYLVIDFSDGSRRSMSWPHGEYAKKDGQKTAVDPDYYLRGAGYRIRSNGEKQYTERVGSGIVERSCTWSQIVARAKSKWNGASYNAATKNCQHFCNAMVGWLIRGVWPPPPPPHVIGPVSPPLDPKMLMTGGWGSSPTI